MGILASLAGTCFGHRIDPRRYLTRLLVDLSVALAAELDAWLPGRWKLRQLTPPA